MRFAIATLGCKVNQYDSAIIEQRLGAAGLERREFDQAADLYVINTCTVTNRADAESLRLARRARRLNPRARVVMTGCLAQASPLKLAMAPEIDQVIGLGRLDDIVRAAGAGPHQRVLVDDLRRHRAPIELGAVSLAGHTRAFLKVQEGCDQFCSFCIVPRSRGASRSVEPRRLLEALDQLHQRGFQEVILTGVHLGGYGRDLTPPVTLEDLLEMVAERCRIGRVRLSSLDPEELSDRVIAIVAQSERFCRHFHLPLQAGEDELLVRMRRRYDRAYYRERLDRVLAAMPEAALGTDLIVGFPGESRQHFERYFKFVEQLPLSYFHVFPFSVRSGTGAAKMNARVEATEVTRRAELMRELGEDKRRRFAARFVGVRLRVLLEQRGASGRLEGYSRNYIRVLTDAPDLLRNHEVEVEATAAVGATLAARRVAPPIAQACQTAAAR